MAANDEDEKKQARSAARKRRAFESSNPVGKTNPPVGRMDGIREKVGKAYDSVPIKHLYRVMGYQDHSPNYPGQMELEGPKGSDVWHGQHTMNPVNHMMPVNRRWEDFSPKEQARVLRSAAKFGVSPKSAHRALAAHVDQAYATEGGSHDSFYAPSQEFTRNGSRTPRNELKNSAKENGVPFHVQAAANAITSPQNTFVAADKNTGKAHYPNNEAASHAIQWAKSGKTRDEYEYHPDYYVPPEEKVKGPNGGKPKKAPDDTRKYPVQGYPRNHALAIDVTKELMNGKPLSEAWKPSRGEKVSAYHNSLVDPHGSSQFWVSDTHSGGAAFAPHLPDKSGPGGQAAYMGINGIHALHDYIARNVAAERGLRSLSNMQSAQWSQNKRYIGDKTDDALNSYGANHEALHTEPHKGHEQGHLF
jgi:hypothetical protein